MKRIVIDFQSSQGESSHRGIGKYTLSLFTALIPVLARDNEVIALLSGNFFADSVAELRSTLETIEANFQILTWNGIVPTYEHLNDTENSKRNQINESIYRNYLKSLRPDFIFFGSLFEGWSDNCTVAVPTGIPYGAVFYDAIPLIYPAQYLDPNPDYKAWYLERCKLVKNADILLSISNSASQEAIDYFDVTPQKIVNIAGASILSKHNNQLTLSASFTASTLKKFNITKPYILYTGATDTRKNHLRLIKAYSNLPQSLKDNYQLVIAGGLPAENLEKFTKMCHLAHLKIPENVCFTNKISEGELNIIYQNAYLFIMPSLHEGFGLPILEAMEFDLPVLGSRSSSIPEIIKQDFAMFDPTDVADMTAKMQQALTNPIYLEKLKENSLTQRQYFSWARSALTAKQAITQFLNFAPSYNKLAVSNNLEKLDYPILKNKDIVKLAKAIADNTPRVLPRFYVEVTEYHITDSKSGIQRVVKNILNEVYGLLKGKYEVVPIYRLVPPHQHYDEAYNTNYRRSTKTEETILSIFGHQEDVIDFKNNDIFLVLDLTMETSIHSAHLTSQARAQGTKVYYVVYDLLPMQFPEFFPSALPTVFEQWLRQLTLRSDGILCISRTVADELLTWIKEEGIEVPHPLKIGWFHLGVDFQAGNFSKGLPTNAPAMLERIKNTPSFVMVGTVEPRKAHLQVLLAFNELWKQGIEINLVIVGKRGWNNELTIDLIESDEQFNKKLIWLSGVTDEYLTAILKNSAALIAASYGEGFGLPIIEAGYYGIPIIARDIPVFREVGTSNTTFFTANNPEQLATFLQDWLTHDYRPNQVHVINPNAGITWRQGTEQLLTNIFFNDWYINLPYLKGHFVRRCRSDNSNEMASLVGERTGFTLKTTGKEGYFVYGPYWHLEPNRYRLDIKMTINNPSQAYIDTTYNKGTQIIFKKMLHELNVESYKLTTLHFEFTLEEAITDFELHIWVDDQAELQIEEYVLRQID